MPLDNYYYSWPEGSEDQTGKVTSWDDFYGSVGQPREPSGLTTRSVQTVAVDPFTGSPIVNSGGGNMPATRSAMAAQGSASGGMVSSAASGMARGSASFAMPTIYQPSGSLVANKDQTRLTGTPTPFTPGQMSAYQPAPAMSAQPRSALGAATLMGGMAPNIPAPAIGANPGMGTAMIGNGVMSPNIKPNAPPPGVAPTVWNDQMPATSQALAAKTVQPGQMFQSAGYLYQSQPGGGYRQVGVADQYQGMSPSEQYDAVNRNEQQQAIANSADPERYAAAAEMNDIWNLW